MKILKISLIIYALLILIFIAYFANQQSGIDKSIEENKQNITDLETIVQQDIVTARGQKIYIPAYSNIQGAEEDSSILLSINLSVRNTDPSKAINLSYVDFYNTGGSLSKRFLSSPLIIEPMATKHFYIAQSDTIGGIGANFYLEWVADTIVNEPIVEAIMLGSNGSQGFSWSSKGLVVRQFIP